MFKTDEVVQISEKEEGLIGTARVITCKKGELEVETITPHPGSRLAFGYVKQEKGWKIMIPTYGTGRGINPRDFPYNIIKVV